MKRNDTLNIDMGKLLVGTAIGFGLYYLAKYLSKEDFYNAQPIEPTGSVNIPGLGVVPATNYANQVFVFIDGKWMNLSAVQAAYEQSSGNSSSGGGFGAWLNQNSGQVLDIVENILNIFNNNNVNTPPISL